MLKMAHYDVSWDVRDRARMIQCALHGASGIHEILSSSVVSAKPQPPVYSDKSRLSTTIVLQDEDVTFGSTLHLIGRGVTGFQTVQPWTDSPTPGALRQEEHRDGVPPQTLPDNVLRPTLPPIPTYATSDSFLWVSSGYFTAFRTTSKS